MRDGPIEVITPWSARRSTCLIVPPARHYRAARDPAEPPWPQGQFGPVGPVKSVRNARPAAAVGSGNFRSSRHTPSSRWSSSLIAVRVPPVWHGARGDRRWRLQPNDNDLQRCAVVRERCRSRRCGYRSGRPGGRFRVLLLRCGPGNGQSGLAAVVDDDRGAVGDIAAEQGTADPGFDLALQVAAQRPGPVDGIEAFGGDVPARSLGQLQVQLPSASRWRRSAASRSTTFSISGSVSGLNSTTSSRPAGRRPRRAGTPPRPRAPGCGGYRSN